MTERFHRPTQFRSGQFESFHGGDDPAVINRQAHETANALLARVRENPSDEVIERLVAYTDTNGVDAIAELWARANAASLPGALWRIYLIRLLIRQDAAGVALIFQRGTEISTTIDPLVAGAEAPTGPAEITELADRILRGAFVGDFAVALDRAAAFCRVVSAGCTSLADDSEATAPERASELTRRALRFSTTASELTRCAALWRSDSLD